ncbi:signal transduction histidine kinase [Amycolatopsis lexingtonensis]|uniref:histidine kinase n=2 Tax=Amycolatopsis lexingtonensis TaxID=218822 RepID=A0ABR9I1C1_9PSEU|nr:histidine kinase [Amycolatopsis lexingtonensis]MBE1496984.1 signal transduction histidine kinase [Amycolatopsis lexingtonensis]
MQFPRLNSLPVWQQDALIALTAWAIGSGVYVAGIHRLLAGYDHAPLWVRLVELTALCGLELLRRWVPGALLLATAVLAVDIWLGPSLPVLIVYTDFLYAATLYGSRRTSRVMIGVAALSVVGTLAAVLLLAQQWRLAVLAAVSVLPFVVTPVWWAANVRQQRDIAETERANAAQLAKIAELDRRAAIAAERQLMARDLHDVIAGHLSAIAIQSEAALSLPDPQLARAVLESVRENSVSALEEMRAMIGLLKADNGYSEATAPARLAELAKLVESARASGLEVNVGSTVDAAMPLPAAVDLTAYRIAQEALTNAVKHAPGGKVDVDVCYFDGVLAVEVRNDVHHPQDGDSAGTGLLNMRERADAVGGKLTAGPAGEGWLVRAELPVSDPR